MQDLLVSMLHHSRQPPSMNDVKQAKTEYSAYLDQLPHPEGLHLRGSFSSLVPCISWYFIAFSNIVCCVVLL